MNEGREFDILISKVELLHPNMKYEQAAAEASRQLLANERQRREMRRKLFLELPDGPLFRDFDEYCLFMDLPAAKADEFLKFCETRGELLVAMTDANEASRNRI